MGHLGLSYIIRCVYVFLIDLGTNELSDTRRARRGGRHYALWQADLGEEEEKQGLCWVVRGCACWRLETTGRRGVRPLSGVCGWWAGGDRHTPPPVPAHLPLPLPTGVTSAAILRPTFPSPLGFTGPPAGRSISVSACVVRLCRLLSEASTLLSSPKKKYIAKDNANAATGVIRGEFADGAAGVRALSSLSVCVCACVCVSRVDRAHRDVALADRHYPSTHPTSSALGPVGRARRLISSNAATSPLSRALRESSIGHADIIGGRSVPSSLYSPMRPRRRGGIAGRCAATTTTDASSASRKRFIGGGPACHPVAARLGALKIIDNSHCLRILSLLSSLHCREEHTDRGSSREQVQMPS